jgi:VIT1/CCC1 family predicted Fe2+/Mn2+ transporter
LADVNRFQVVLAAAIVGAADGGNTGIALVLGNKHLLFALAVLIAFSGSLSMAQGEFVSVLADPKEHAIGSIPRVAAMGVATFLGSFLPCVPALALDRRTLSEVLAVGTGLLIAVLVGHVSGGKRRNYAISVLSFIAVAIPTAILAVSLGIGG